MNSAVIKHDVPNAARQSGVLKGVIACIVLAAMENAAATPLQVVFSGELTSVADHNGVLDPSVVVGAAFESNYTIDPVGAVDLDPDPDISVFAYDSSFTMEFGNMVLEAPSLEIRLVLDAATFVGQRYVLSGQDFSSNGFQVDLMRIMLDTYSTNLFDGVAPPDHLDLNDFHRGLFQLYAPYLSISGSVTDIVVVPEPSTLALLLCACTVSLCPRRRKQ